MSDIGSPSIALVSEIGRSVQRKGPRKLSFDAVLQPPAERFVWGRMLPRDKPSVLFGPTGAGKSALLAQLVFAVAGRAPSLLGMAIREHGPVLVVTAEDTFDDWLRKAGAVHHGTEIDVESAVQDFYVLDLVDGEARLSEPVSMRAKDGTRRISRAITHLQEDIIDHANVVGAVMIVFETASRFVEDEDNASFTALQSALSRIAQMTGAAVVVTHHATKAASKENDSSIENARGGGAFIYNARNALTLFPARPEHVKAHADRFAAGDLFELMHGKSTSSTKREDPVLLVRCGTPHGAFFQRPIDVEASPELAAAAKARQERQRREDAECLGRLYALVENILRSRTAISPSYLYNERYTDLVVTKRKMRALVEAAMRDGILLETGRSARGVTLGLGRDPRKEIAS